MCVGVSVGRNAWNIFFAGWDSKMFVWADVSFVSEREYIALPFVFMLRNKWFGVK